MAWSDRLAGATPRQRAAYEIEDFGTSIHWPGVDEDIGLSAFLGVSEDVIYDALGWKGPSMSTKDHLSRTAGAG